MRILLQFMPDVDIDSEAIDDDLRLEVVPKFDKTSSVKPLATVTVKGKGGQERRFTLAVNGRDGRVVVRQVDEDEPAFDKLGPNDTPPEAPTGEGGDQP